MKKVMHVRRKRLQGIAAMEFALVFPVLFLMMYGMLSYSLVFAAQHSLSESAAAGARAAVRFISANDNVEDRQTAACTQAAYGVEWLKAFNKTTTVTCKSTILSQCSTQGNTSIKCLSVSMELSGNMLPSIFLPIPDQLSATAVTQMALKY